MNNYVIFIRLGGGILSFKRRPVKGSTDIEVHLKFEILNVSITNVFIGGVFIGFGSGSIQVSKDCFFHLIKIFCKHSGLDVLFLEPFVILLIHENLVLLVIVDLDDDSVNRNLFSG